MKYKEYEPSKLRETRQRRRVNWKIWKRKLLLRPRDKFFVYFKITANIFYHLDGFKKASNSMWRKNLAEKRPPGDKGMEFGKEEVEIWESRVG